MLCRNSIKEDVFYGAKNILVADKALKFKFLKFIKENGYENQSFISNIDDDDEKWFSIQLGKNEVEYCFHLEVTTDRSFQLHIETNGIISKFDCEKAFEYLKNEEVFPCFDFEKGGWNSDINGYFADYKNKISSSDELFSAILEALKNADEIITNYDFS